MNATFSVKQAQAFDDWRNPSIREICYEGGARSGKTYLIIAWILTRAALYPNSRHMIARQFRDNLVKTVWRQTLHPALKAMYPNGGYSENRSELIVTLHNGSTIWGYGLDTDDRVEKIMGSEFATIFINEATQINWNTYQKVKTRLSQNVYTPGGQPISRKIVIDCNPRSEHHWIYQYFILGKDPKEKKPLIPEHRAVLKHRKWFPWDNPFLADDVLESYRNLSGVERQRLYEGQWVNQEGLVYPNATDAVVDPFKIPEGWVIAGAVDFGYTNPFVHLWFAFDKSNETWYLFDEYYQAQKTVNQHCVELRKRKPCEWRVADHDAEDRETMRNEGFPSMAAIKDIQAGVQAVTDLLSRDKGIKLRIFSSCIHTIEELQVYSWQQPKEGRNAKEEPIKENDHAMDALRYFAMQINRPKIRRGPMLREIEL